MAQQFTMFCFELIFHLFFVLLGVLGGLGGKYVFWYLT